MANAALLTGTAVVFSWAATTTAAWAQTGQATGEQADATIEEMVVQGARVGLQADDLPQKISVIDAASIRQQLTLFQDPTSVISQLVPSFSPTRQKLTGAGETFRGRSPLFLIDGVPQSNPLRDGSRDGNTIDLSVIERVEVIFGANAIQGLGATGGAINYVTVDAPTDGSLLARATVQGTASNDFDDDGFEYRAAGVIGRKFGAFDVVAGAAYTKRGLFFDAEGRSVGVDATQGDLADSEQRNFFGKIGYDITENQRVQVTVNDFLIEGDGDFFAVAGDRDAGIPTTSERGTGQGDPASNDVTTLSVDYTHADLLGGELALQFYSQDFEAVFGGGVFNTFQDPTIAPVGTLFDQSANASEKIGGRVTYVRPELFDLPVRGVVGVDILRDRTRQFLVQTNRDWVPLTSFLNVAPFIQTIVDPTPWLTLAGGVRIETARLKVDDYTTIAGVRPSFEPVEVAGGDPDFTELLPNAGAVIRTPVDGLTLYGTYSQGFGIADIGRVLRAVSDDGVDVDDLFQLEPVVTTNIEGGVEYDSALVGLQVAFYQSNADLGSRLVDNDGIFEVRRQRTEIMGVELSGELRPTSWLTLGIRYAYIDGEADTDDDGTVDADLGAADIPPNRFDSYVEAAIGEALAVRLQTFSLFDRDFQDAAGETTASFEGYTTADLIVSYALPVGAVRLGIQNLTDTDYITYFSQAANNRNDRFFAGRGRTFTLSFTAQL